MKQNSIQYLLEKFREGTLTDEERTELEQLTRRDEVMAAASRRATGIVHRRMSLVAATAMIIGAGVMVVLPRESQGPLMAEAKTMPTAEVQTATVFAEEMTMPTETVNVPPRMASRQPLAASRPVAPVQQQATPTESEPIVVCNSQCNADSIINDIKRFLSV